MSPDFDFAIICRRRRARIIGEISHSLSEITEENQISQNDDGVEIRNQEPVRFSNISYLPEPCCPS